MALAQSSPPLSHPVVAFQDHSSGCELCPINILKSSFTLMREYTTLPLLPILLTYAMLLRSLSSLSALAVQITLLSATARRSLDALVRKYARTARPLALLHLRRRKAIAAVAEKEGSSLGNLHDVLLRIQSAHTEQEVWQSDASRRLSE